jgi:hypothetical protein
MCSYGVPYLLFHLCSCGRRVMILLELTVLASGVEVGNRIGNPQALRGSGEQTSRQQMSETSMC